MHQHEVAPDLRQTPSRTLHTLRTLRTLRTPFAHPSDAPPAQHPLHNSHAIPRGANLDRPHKPRNSAIMDSKFERLTGKLHATLWGNHRRNVGGQGAAEPRTRPSSSARPAPTAGRTAPGSPARRCRCASSSADRPRTHRARPGAGARPPRRACDRSPGSPATGG